MSGTLSRKVQNVILLSTKRRHYYNIGGAEERVGVFRRVLVSRHGLLLLGKALP